ncbi:diaminopimelate decarboxylase [Sphingomicrobium aestuariivivum]|uniref:diaminopimelate decarboxylase n=1 Tax=Sphingomicrobium aestuariivivum TaxID=1582356 RepID=UPI001FD6BEEF|nr:diaminopimelate decarboxylase [Sphingomicrobium aestuariivivum]MCJ8190310.1 diaminopimelate decarboxylase [Sphingomicrobium aestuariivivum]
MAMESPSPYRGYVEHDGVLHCEGVPLPAIAEAVGTPVYVYSAAMLRAAARRMKAALDGLDDPLIAYAVKANPNPAVLHVLAQEGLGADIVSIGEYAHAVDAGMAKDHILFSGVGKTREEMEKALTGGLLQFNIESIEEAHDLSAVATAMGKTAPVGLRINPDVVAGTHEKISTGQADTKFGIPGEQAMEAFRTARALPGLDVTGVTIHIGSQLTSLDPLETAFTRLGEVIRALRHDGCDLSLADLGGGLGVDYGPDQPDPPSVEAYAAMVKRVTRDWDIRLAFEPGRSISGEAGVLLARVIRIKPGAKAPWLIVDAAMNDLMRPALYDAYHHIVPVEPRGEPASYNVVGPVCETGDTFARRRIMQRVEPGDLVAFRTVGAYGAAMSNGYNSRPLAPEVLVDGDRWAQVRQRVDLAEKSAMPLPDWLEN